MLTSLAGTSKTDYKPIQIRIRGNELNIQGKVPFGTKVNRDYGVAQVISRAKHSDLSDYLEGRRALVPSQAGTDALYVPAQAAIRGERVHLQFVSKEFNRNYGAAFDIPITEAAALAQFITGDEDVTDSDEAETESEPEQEAEEQPVHVGC